MTAFNQITEIQISPSGDSVTISFHDGVFRFHSQWLHDAQVDEGPSKIANEVFTQIKSTFSAQAAAISGTGFKTRVNIQWNDGKASSFPGPWLRVFAPLVAKRLDDFEANEKSQEVILDKGWQTPNLEIPEVWFEDIVDCFENPRTKAAIFDLLLQPDSAGIIKIVGLPEPNIDDERATQNAILTKILKQLFGEVFKHARRAPETTSNISSHVEADVKKGEALPNYDTQKELLPHTDHTFYELPGRVQGLYCLEGESINTFVSCPAVLATFKEETPELLGALEKAPMAIGRLAHWYQPPLYQGNVNSIMTSHPVSKEVKFRWHPHLSGFLLSPHDEYAEARNAVRKFQQISRRESHELRVHFQPGDMYIWDNHRLLHGREQVLSEPRTSVSLTVPEQAVLDSWRAMKIERLKEGGIEEKWLLHVPQRQLGELVQMLDTWDEDQ